jgi:DNA-binding transcriptional LysR family regulator
MMRWGSRRETLSWRYEVQLVNTAIALVRAGLGMTIIPSLAMSREEKLRHPTVSRQVGIIYKRSAPLSPLADELRRLIVQEFVMRTA